MTTEKQQGRIEGLREALGACRYIKEFWDGERSNGATCCMNVINDLIQQATDTQAPEAHDAVATVYSVPVGTLIGPEGTEVFSHTVIAKNRLLLNQELYTAPPSIADATEVKALVVALEEVVAVYDLGKGTRAYEALKQFGKGDL